jgi:hypothetical protein
MAMCGRDTKRMPGCGLISLTISREQLYRDSQHTLGCTRVRSSHSRLPLRAAGRPQRFGVAGGRNLCQGEGGPHDFSVPGLYVVVRGQTPGTRGGFTHVVEYGKAFRFFSVAWRACPDELRSIFNALHLVLSAGSREGSWPQHLRDSSTGGMFNRHVEPPQCQPCLKVRSAP